MKPKMIVVPPSEAVGQLARDIAPSSVELVLALEDSAEYNAALPTAEFIVCYPHVKLSDAFYKKAPKIKLEGFELFLLSLKSTKATRIRLPS